MARQNPIVSVKGEKAMKLKMLTLVVALAAAMGLLACSQAANGEVDEKVDIGGHSLHLYCLGEGSSTVVIDVGWAESYTSWQFILERLSHETRVCAYDRAGYGSSELGPFPRSTQQISDELKMLLEQAGIEGPYVLVGHSLGALNVQLFVHQHPSLVQGAVLLDPPPLRFIADARFPELYHMAELQAIELEGAAEAVRQSAEPEERAKADYYQTLASEHEMMATESVEQILAIRSFGDMPLVVVGSGKPNPVFGDSAEAFQQFWIEQSRELAAKSTNGTFVLADESGHHLHVDVPDLVLDAIREVVHTR